MATTWNGEEITEADIRKRLTKRPKGAFLLERKEARKTLDAEEDAQKALARARDRRCRWPHCEVCRRYKDIALEVAHVLQAKGMSGDRTGKRSTVDKLMVLDKVTHAAQERHEKEIVPLDPEQGTNGPCEFWADDENGQRYLVARETAPFILERD